MFGRDPALPLNTLLGPKMRYLGNDINIYININMNCTFVLVDITFNCDFIVCKNLTRPLIFGRDFLIQNPISVRYSENGKYILDHKQQELVASICVETKPQLSLANSMTLPGRTLAVVHVNNNLNPEQSGQLYEIEPNYLLTNEYQTCVSFP